MKIILLTYGLEFIDLMHVENIVIANYDDDHKPVLKRFSDTTIRLMGNCDLTVSDLVRSTGGIK